MERRACLPGVSLLRAFFFCRVPSLAYPLSVKLSIIGKASAETARVDGNGCVGTAAPSASSGQALGRPIRAQLGRLFTGSERSPA